MEGVMSAQPYFGSPGFSPMPAVSPAASAAPSPMPSPYPDLSSFKIAGQGTFNQGLSATNPSGTISPETQQVLDIIRKNQDYSATKGMSEASALASRRGLAGSSVEQFGVQSANEAATRAGNDATANTLNQFMAQQAALRQLQAQGLFQRAGQEATLGSDEVASERNMDFARQQLALQSLLGQQGIDVARENIGASRDIAADQQRNSLIQSGASLLAPYALPALFGSPAGIGSSGGIFSGLFGGGAGGSAVLSGAGAANPGAASSLFPGGLGAGGVGTGVSATGAGVGSSGALAALGPAALAVGGVLGYQSLSDKGKSLIAPMVNPLKTAKTVGTAVSNIGSKVSNSVKSVFRF